MANELVEQHDQIPDHLRHLIGKKTRLGNLDESDRIVPRLQLLQALSPEVTAHENAKAGHFWHNLMMEDLGTSLKAVFITVRKSIVLWAPRGDDRGILARSTDCVNWDDNANMTFSVKPKGVAKPIVWETKGNVKESKLTEFGSSIPGDNRSNPAASLTYHCMWYLPDLNSAVVMINTRSQIKPTRTLFEMIDARKVPSYTQLWDISSTQEKGAEGPYFNIAYRAAGYPPKEVWEHTEQLFNKYDVNQEDWAPSDENVSDEPSRGGNGGPVNEKMASKF
jgi:hypothetical protein